MAPYRRGPGRPGEPLCGQQTEVRLGPLSDYRKVVTCILGCMIHVAVCTFVATPGTMLSRAYFRHTTPHWRGAAWALQWTHGLERAAQHGAVAMVLSHSVGAGRSQQL